MIRVVLSVFVVAAFSASVYADVLAQAPPEPPPVAAPDTSTPPGAAQPADKSDKAPEKGAGAGQDSVPGANGEKSSDKAEGPADAASKTSAEQDKDVAAIRKNVAAYVAAFNRGDAKALAAMWSPDAVYINRDTGERLTGREAIEKSLAEQLEKQKGLELSADVHAVEFVSPNVAIERGTAALSSGKKGEEPAEFEYTAVHIRQGGKWLLDRISETEQLAPRHERELRKLAWMIGHWVDQEDDARIDTRCQWARNRSFLVRSFTVSIDGEIDITGMQVIGWDAADKQIKSWVFDSEGGHATATWEQKGDRWYVTQAGVLSDGRKSSAVNIIKKVSDDAFTWQSVNRIVGGKLLPNTAEVEIVRSRE